jgi:CHASE3 domain
MKATANDERGYLMTGDAEFRKGIAERIETIHASLADARKVSPNAEHEKAVDTFAEQFDAWAEAVDAEFDVFETDREAAIALALEHGRGRGRGGHGGRQDGGRERRRHAQHAPGRPAHPRSRAPRCSSWASAAG